MSLIIVGLPWTIAAAATGVAIQNTVYDSRHLLDSPQPTTVLILKKWKYHKKIFKAPENYGLVIKSASKAIRIARMVNIKLFYYGLILL